jgi:CMP-N,N'-diacetyllegionaminic acid synthase
MLRYSTLCTVCARGNSKGVKNKNIRDLAGKPLIAYTLEQARRSNLFEHVVVSSDSVQIQEISKKFGGEVFFTRDAELSTDTAGKLPVVQDALRRSEVFYKKTFDYIVDLDATSPLRNVEDITSAMHQFLDKDYDNLITAMPARRSPYFNLIETDEKGRVRLSKKLDKPIVRRQDSPKCFDMNASIYIWKRSALINNTTIFLEKTGLYVMPEERSVDIDNEIDFKFVEFIITHSE